MKIGMYNSRVGTFGSGGTETFIREISDKLSDEHEVVIYTGDGEIVPAVKSLAVTLRPIPFLREGDRLNDGIEQFSPVHSHEIESVTMYFAAKWRGVIDSMADEIDVLSTHSLLDNALVSRSSPVPVVFRIPGIRQGSFRWRQLLRLDESTIRLANSEATAQRLRNWLGAKTDGVVYAGLDLEQFTQDGPVADRTDDPTILYLGRVDAGKGLFDLLEAHAKLRESRRVILRIVGEGALTEHLKTRVDELGTSETVEFVGAVPHDAVQTYYRAADVYCLPSYSEGFPLGNIEAMACGLPVVSTDIAPVREQITPGETGLLFQPGDVETLTGHLDRLLSTPELRRRFSVASRSRVQELSWERQAGELEAFYRRAIGE